MLGELGYQIEMPVAYVVSGRFERERGDAKNGNDRPMDKAQFYGIYYRFGSIFVAIGSLRAQNSPIEAICTAKAVNSIANRRFRLEGRRFPQLLLLKRQ